MCGFAVTTLNQSVNQREAHLITTILIYYIWRSDIKMKLRPLQDRVLVERIEASTKSAGGLYIPDTAKEKPQEGVVAAVGKGKRKEDGSLVPLDIKEGDKILFSKYAGNDVTLDGKEYIIMREDDILGVL